MMYVYYLHQLLKLLRLGGSQNKIEFRKKRCIQQAINQTHLSKPIGLHVLTNLDDELYGNLTQLLKSLLERSLLYSRDLKQPQSSEIRLKKVRLLLQRFQTFKFYTVCTTNHTICQRIIYKQSFYLLILQLTVNAFIIFQQSRLSYKRQYYINYSGFKSRRSSKFNIFCVPTITISHKYQPN